MVVMTVVYASDPRCAITSRTFESPRAQSTSITRRSSGPRLLRSPRIRSEFYRDLQSALSAKSRYTHLRLLRALSTSLLSLLLAATLLWGACMSCDQYFMFGQSHSCCNPDGHCKKKTPGQNSSGSDCNQIAFDHHKSIDLHFDLSAVAIETIALPSAELYSSPVRHDSVPLDASPPDLQVLYSTLLI